MESSKESLINPQYKAHSLRQQPMHWTLQIHCTGAQTEEIKAPQNDGEDKMRPCEINGGAATDILICDEAKSLE
jgi:hypothetical protein